MGRKGFFVCIEGLDGSGKTTQAKLLADRLKSSYNTVYTAEPSLGKIGEFIKEHCLHVERRGSSVVEALLFAADRIEHLEVEVIPALNEGKTVVCDRYVYSSLAYQGATGLDLGWVKKLNEYAKKPDLAIFIDVEPETVIQRLKSERSVMENLKTQRKVRETYLKCVEKGDLVLIDGNASKEKVAERVFGTVVAFLEKAC